MRPKKYTVGQILCIAGNNGVVLDVYEKEKEHGIMDSAESYTVLRMGFIKNAQRQRQSELVDLSQIPARVISTATVADLLTEWDQLRETQQRYVDGLVEWRGG